MPLLQLHSTRFVRSLMNCGPISGPTASVRSPCPSSSCTAVVGDDLWRWCGPIVPGIDASCDGPCGSLCLGSIWMKPTTIRALLVALLPVSRARRWRDGQHVSGECRGSSQAADRATASPEPSPGRCVSIGPTAVPDQAETFSALDRSDASRMGLSGPHTRLLRRGPPPLAFRLTGITVRSRADPDRVSA